MKKILCILTVVLCGLVQTDAAPIKAPANFKVNGKQAVFIDIQNADYSIQIDTAQKTVSAKSVIEFVSFEEGHTLFDLVPNPSSVLLDGEIVVADEVKAPDQKSSYRMLSKSTPAGAHRLEIEHSLSELVEFKQESAQLGFWFSDLDPRNFLEQFLPANLEYDQYPSKIEVRVESENKHRLFTNAAVENSQENTWNLQTPDHFNSSSLFFHLASEATHTQKNFEYQSLDGRLIPVTIYKKANGWANLEGFQTKTTNTLDELEDDYGPFPHPRIVIFANQRFPGGMEYHGATITNLWALSHELTHSYFGRGLMPANGNAGWLDEAIASWRDDGYKRLETPGYKSANMANHSHYRRDTDTKAYNEGSRFMAYIDHKIHLAHNEESLKGFLRQLLDKKLFETWTTGSFIEDLELFAGQNFDPDFSTYAYGADDLEIGIMPMGFGDFKESSPYHPKLTAELREVLY